MPERAGDDGEEEGVTRRPEQGKARGGGGTGAGEPGSGGAAAWRRLLGPGAAKWGREEAGRDLKGSNGPLVPVSAMNRD